MVSGISSAAPPRQDDAITRSTVTCGVAFWRSASSRASHDKAACTGAKSKEIEYIWGLQRVAHHQGKFTRGSFTERTDALPRQTAETPMWNNPDKTEAMREKDKATIRPRDPDPGEPHEILDYRAKMQACHEFEVLQQEHEESDCEDGGSGFEIRDSRSRILCSGDEDGNLRFGISARTMTTDSMCGQDGFMQDATTTEESTRCGEEEESWTDSMVETASEEAFQYARDEPAKEALKENQLEELWQARGKEKPEERQGAIYDTEERCCQEELMQFCVVDLGPVYEPEDKDELEGATTVAHEHDVCHIVPGHECAEELERSKPSACLPDESFLARTPRTLRNNSSGSTVMKTPEMTLSLPPSVLAEAVSRPLAADIPRSDLPKISCAGGFTVSAVPSLKARALLSTRHWRGCGSLSKYHKLGTSPVPAMWDPFCKLSIGLDSQSQQPAPCLRPSEHLLRVRWVPIKFHGPRPAQGHRWGSGRNDST